LPLPVTRGAAREQAAGATGRDGRWPVARNLTIKNLIVPASRDFARLATVRNRIVARRRMASAPGATVRNRIVVAQRAS
jgi:hypothetical protein